MKYLVKDQDAVENLSKSFSQVFHSILAVQQPFLKMGMREDEGRGIKPIYLKVFEP